MTMMNRVCIRYIYTTLYLAQQQGARWRVSVSPRSRSSVNQKIGINWYPPSQHYHKRQPAFRRRAGLCELEGNEDGDLKVVRQLTKTIFQSGFVGTVFLDGNASFLFTRPQPGGSDRPAFVEHSSSDPPIGIPISNRKLPARSRLGKATISPFPKALPLAGLRSWHPHPKLSISRCSEPRTQFRFRNADCQWSRFVSLRPRFSPWRVF